MKWEKIENYLFIEKKLDRSTKKCLFYRFRYFDDFLKKNNLILEKESLNIFVKHLIDEGKQLGTINNYIKIVKHIFNCYGVLLGVYPLFTVIQKPIIPLTKHEAIKILNTSLPYYRNRREINRKIKTAIMFLLCTGLRVSEMCSLTWDDVLEDQVIIRDPKNNKMRYVPLSQKLISLIYKLKKRSVYVFGSSQGRLKPSYFNLQLQERARTAGIKKHVHAHLLKHTFVTQCLKRNENTAKVARITGNSIETIEHYIHFQTRDLRSIVNHAGRFISS